MNIHTLSDEGFTGLEAAIVLIAFVVVAAVFSYVALGTGFFTTQAAQVTVHKGVEQVSSGMVVEGNVYGIKDINNDYLDYVKFSVANTAGGSGIDLSDTVVSYTDENGGRNENLPIGPCPTNLVSGTTWCAGSDTDPWMISVGVPATATPNTRFTITFMPPTGAFTAITRTIPGYLTAVQPLY